MKKFLLVISIFVLALSAFALVGCSSGSKEPAPEPAVEGASSVPAWAKDLVKGDSKTVLVAADTAYPPFESANADNTGFEGFDVDIMNAVGDKLGLTFQYITYDWDSIIPGLAAGTDFDMICSALTIKAERAEAVDFSEPYFMDSFGMAVPTDSTLASYKDLKKGAKVAIQTSSAAYEWAQDALPKDVKYVLNKDTANLFQSMQAGEADCVIQDYSMTANFAADEKRNAKIVERIDDTDQYFGMAFQKSDKGAAMKADIQTAFNEVVADGTYATIYEKWFGVAPDFTPGDKTLAEILAK